AAIPSLVAIVVTSAIPAFNARARDRASGEVTAPPDVQAPLPMDPSSVKELGPVTIIVKAPFAAVFPPTWLIATCVPVWKPWGVAVVMAMGEVWEAPVPVRVGPPMAV